MTRAPQRRELAGAGHEIGVDVGLDRGDDRRAVLRGGGGIDRRIATRIDHDRLLGCDRSRSERTPARVLRRRTVGTCDRILRQSRRKSYTHNEFASGCRGCCRGRRRRRPRVPARHRRRRVSRPVPECRPRAELRDRARGEPDDRHRHVERGVGGRRWPEHDQSSPRHGARGRVRGGRTGGRHHRGTTVAGNAVPHLRRRHGGDRGADGDAAREAQRAQRRRRHGSTRRPVLRGRVRPRGGVPREAAAAGA